VASELVREEKEDPGVEPCPESRQGEKSSKKEKLSEGGKKGGKKVLFDCKGGEKPSPLTLSNRMKKKKKVTSNR